MEIGNAALVRVLELTKRPQTVAGKPQAQVIACVLDFDDDRCSTTSLVRDGKTSLSKFVVAAKGEGAVPIPDIDRLLGVLKFHGSNVLLELNNNKLKIKSGSKQTTILADVGGLAFPHSTETISEWDAKSKGLADQIDASGAYTLRDGSKRESFFSWTVDATELFEALRCDNMNAQRLNRYHLSWNGEAAKMTVLTGDELKGQTESSFDSTFVAGEGADSEWEATFEGGLENVVKGMDGEITLRFLDFRPEGQGIRLILDCGPSGFVYQASVLK